MKNFLRRTLTVLLLISLLTISVSAAATVPGAVMRAKDSVVRIIAEYSDGVSSGTGFVIANGKQGTLVVTNYHVIEGEPASIHVFFGRGDDVTATVLAPSAQRDLCVLKLDYKINIDPVALSKKDAVQGDAVYAVGFPGAADYLSDTLALSSDSTTVTDGIVSAIRQMTLDGYGVPTTVLQISAAINHGSSGGPLFDEKGRVVGINSYGVDDSQGINGAIAVSELHAFLDAFAIPAGGGISAGSVSPLLIGAIGGAVVIILLLFILLRRKLEKKEAMDMASPSMNEYTPPRKKTLFRRPLTYICAVVILAAGVVFGSYGLSSHYADIEQFSKANDLLLTPQVIELIDPNYDDYIRAGIKFEKGEYLSAYTDFSAFTNGYRSSVRFSNESLYRNAEDLLEKNEIIDGLRYFSVLADVGYGDAAERVVEIADQKTESCLAEKDYFTLVRIFQIVKKSSFPEKNSAMEELSQKLYDEAVKLYRKNNTVSSDLIFMALEDYERSEDYHTLLSAKLNASNPQKAPKLDEIVALVNFEDGKDILCNQLYFIQYLSAIWVDEYGNVKLQIVKDQVYEDNMPTYCVNGYVYIIKPSGLIMVGRQRSAIDYLSGTLFSQDQKVDKKIAYISENSISVYCYKDKSTHILYRQ